MSELSRACLAIDGSLEPVLTRTSGLTEYAWRFRYPGASYEPDAAGASGWLERGEEVVRQIENRLPRLA